MTAVDRNDVISFVAGSLAGEAPLCVEDAVAAALRLLDEFDDHGWSVEDGKIPPMEEIHVEFAGLDLTPKWMTLGPRRYDVLPSGTIDRAVADAVASTLSYVATWHTEEDDVTDYRGRAETIRALSGRWSDSTCCPVCSEIVCDDDCPLFDLRDRAGVWVGSTGAAGTSSLAAELADRFDERESSAGDEEPEVPSAAGHGQETWTSESGHDFRLGFGPQSGDEYRLDLVRKKDEEPADLVCSNLPRSVAAALYESLGRHLAATDEETAEAEEIEEEVETVNDTMVGITGSGPDARFSWLGAAPGVSREMALRHAAWIVVLADPLDERFPIIKQAVQST